MKNFLLYIFSLSFYISSFGQDTTSNINYFFDDSGISEARYVLKTNLVPIINGNPTIGIDAKLSDRFSLEALVGYQLPHYFIELNYLLLDQDFLVDIKPKSGYSFSLQPKYYLTRNYPETSYISFLYRSRNYKLENNLSQTNIDLAITWGVQFFIGSKVLLDFQYGYGVRIHKGLNQQVNSYEQLPKYSLAMPIALKIGYIL